MWESFQCMGRRRSLAPEPKAAEERPPLYLRAADLGGARECKSGGVEVGEPPAEHGSVLAGADDAAAAGGDPGGGDAAAVSQAPVGELASDVRPHVQQRVVSACGDAPAVSLS